MKKISITGVPEHFNLPWQTLVSKQPFQKEGFLLEWKDEPRGSGAMVRALRESEVDLAVVLTESFVKDKVEGADAEIIGFHVTSPLIWGIHLPGSSVIEDLKQVERGSFLVSRMGSGSHLMGYLLAKHQGWDLNELEFEVIENLDGARKAFSESSDKLFLWERFTTQPLVTSGEFKRVGEIPTPWPCFSIVASARALKTFPEQVKAVRESLYWENRALMDQGTLSIQAISDQYAIEVTHVKEWFSQTTWAKDGTIEKKSLERTLDILLELGIISGTVPPERLVNTAMVNLV